MTLSEFYQKFANIPLEKRFDIPTHAFNISIGGMTLYRIYEKIKALDDEIRPKQIELDNLLKEVEKFI